MSLTPERAKFEQWRKEDRGYWGTRDLRYRDNLGSYEAQSTDHEWRAWQAAYALGVAREAELAGKLREAEFWKKANDNTFQHCADRVASLQRRLTAIEAAARALADELEKVLIVRDLRPWSNTRQVAEKYKALRTALATGAGPLFPSACKTE